MAKRICVIGAGASGLCAIKSCLEDGLVPVCYEKGPLFGGLWRYTDVDVEGRSSVMRSTIINTAKEMTAYSDFPPPPEFATFMHNSRIVEYLTQYADKFNLHPHIHCNKSVIQVKFSKGFEFTGKWVVQVKDQDGTVTEEIFDGVMVCIGHHVYPQMPTLPGMDSFEGEILHTHSYKTPHKFQDKRVVVIGIGNSGGDVAVELSRISSQVYLSTRRGSWVTNRVDDMGRPVDANLNTRFIKILQQFIPWSWTNSIYEAKLNWRFDHEKFRLKPKHRAFSQHVMVNDDLPNRIMAGTVIIKDDIDRITKTGVVFRNDPAEYPIDVIILATGYKISFPFLSDDIIHVDSNNDPGLYKNVFPPELQPATLAVIGMIQPLGSIIPIAEIQARWAVKVFKKQVVLPPKASMKADVREITKNLRKTFVISPRHTIQVDYCAYMDDIATIIGAKPKMWKLFLKDPQLFYACMFGPLYPYQFRLTGPHAWNGAAAAILTAPQRMTAHLNSRESLHKDTIGTEWLMTYIAGFFSFIGFLFLTFVTNILQL